MPVWELENGRPIGHFLKPHSFRGKLKAAFLVSGLEDYVLAGSWIFPLLGGRPVPYKVTDITWSDDTTAIMKLENINDEADATGLKGVEFMAKIDDADWEELTGTGEVSIIGYAIEDEELGAIGTVTDVIEGAAQDIIVGVLKGREIMIPYHEDLIINIDHQAEKIYTRVPEGLI